IGASLLINWGMINSGIALGFPSVAVPPLLGSGPGLHASVSEASWVAGLSFASAPVAALMAGPLIDSIGRRWSLQLLNVTFAAGWLLIAAFPLSLLALYSGRLLTGFGMGLVASTAASYTAEIASVSLRTVLVNFIPIMMAYNCLEELQ
ncbi:sugar transporter ERD6-like 4, partial [Homalodisca vitripennis]|uniref:sugar transporter ERD6-like 4 n=1 Tax=Homalodisca vitripennis TaxID=197043 RepID=UPI001EEC8704